MIKIVIADDHDIVRAGIRKIIESKPDMTVVGEAGNGREALDLCHREKPDVLLLDLDMPDIDGLEVTRQLTVSQPSVRILILTMHDDEEYAERVMKLGAAGFLLKASSPQELPEIIKKVASGKIHVQNSILEKTALKHYRPSTKNPISELSNREYQIMIGLSKGEHIRDIAAKLNLSPSTVATYKKRIMKKFNLTKNSELILFALKHNIITEEG